MTMTANPRAPWTVGSTPPTLPLQRGGKRRPFFLGSLVSPSFCQRITEPLQFFYYVLSHSLTVSTASFCVPIPLLCKEG